MTATATEGLLRWAEVDTAALGDNLRLVHTFLAEGTAVMGMVKSNGYGHGAVIAAGAAVEGGATWLGVYTPDEAMALREAGFDQPLLVVGWSPPESLAQLVDANVDVTVFDAESVRALAVAAGTAKARCHVKVDTGLGRLGVQRAELDGLLVALRDEAARVVVAGVFTHYADPELKDFTDAQHDRLVSAAAAVRAYAPEALVHAAGSGAIFCRSESHHDLVRLGISLYGYSPFRSHPIPELRPAMSVLARVVQVKTVAAGDTVGYGRTWTAERPSRIATVAIGYGQGVPRSLSNRGVMIVNGARCPIAGVVSMDQVTLDVSDAGEVSRGDLALFFGRRWDVSLGADEVARLCDTLPHEVLCGVAATVPRLATA